MRGLARVSLAVALAAVRAPAVPAQLAPSDTVVGAPGWVVEMFLARPAFPERERYLTASLASHAAGRPTPGSFLPTGATAVSRRLYRDSVRAVYATAIRVGPRPAEAEDWYTYLVLEDGRWKIETLRKLDIPQVQYMLVDSMDAKRARGELPDSLLPLLERMRLGTRPDSALRAYIRTHEAELRALAERFAAMRNMVAASVDGQGVSSDDRSVEVGDLVPAMRELNIGALFRHDERPNCVFLKIGGSGSNHVGFIYAPSTCEPPRLHPDDYIYIEAAAPNWYVYKRT